MGPWTDIFPLICVCQGKLFYFCGSGVTASPNGVVGGRGLLSLYVVFVDDGFHWNDIYLTLPYFVVFVTRESRRGFLDISTDSGIRRTWGALLVDWFGGGNGRVK